jgi:hypothetical protein
MMRIATTALGLLVLAACSSGPGRNEAGILPEKKLNVAKAGMLPLVKKIPESRGGITANDTGAIMFICANTPAHEDKEVFIEACNSCEAKRYFYWDGTVDGFRCYACEKPFPNEQVKCPECKRSPHRVRTRHSPKG